MTTPIYKTTTITEAKFWRLTMSVTYWYHFMKWQVAEAQEDRRIWYLLEIEYIHKYFTLLFPRSAKKQVQSCSPLGPEKQPAPSCHLWNALLFCDCHWRLRMAHHPQDLGKSARMMPSASSCGGAGFMCALICAFREPGTRLGTEISVKHCVLPWGPC